jgi:hypothetical protein
LDETIVIVAVVAIAAVVCVLVICYRRRQQSFLYPYEERPVSRTPKIGANRQLDTLRPTWDPAFYQVTNPVTSNETANFYESVDGAFPYDVADEFAETSDSYKSVNGVDICVPAKSHYQSNSVLGLSVL